MYKIFLANLLLLSLQSQIYAKTDLELLDIHFGKNSIELSGLALYQNKIITVGDKPQDHFIYEVNFEPHHRFNLRKLINLNRTNGFLSYLFKDQILNWGDNKIPVPLDLEGLSVCDNDIYFVNERARHLLKVSNNIFEHINFSLHDFFKLNNIHLTPLDLNAGLEGLAIDCKNQIAYIANEREPANIMTFNLKTHKFESIFAITPETISELKQNYSGLFIENNFLYVLERNHHTIAKFDLTSKKVINRVSFLDLGKIKMDELYKSMKKFGIAEGLLLTKEAIYIALDNNKTKLSKKAKKIFSVKGRVGALLKFKRPANF